MTPVQPTRPSRLAPRIPYPEDLVAETRVLEARIDRTKRRRLFRNALKGRGWEVAILVMAVVLGIGILWLLRNSAWLLALIVTAVLINLCIFGIARQARRFAWVGVAIFLSVPLFGGLVTVVRTTRTPTVQPVALIRKSDNVGLCGIYITETDKRVWVGRVEPNPGDDGAIHGTGRIFWVPDSDVDMIKIGTLQRLSDANGRAPKLLAELYQDRAEEPAKPPAHPRPTTKPAPHTVADACTATSLKAPYPITGNRKPPKDDSDP